MSKHRQGCLEAYKAADANVNKCYNDYLALRDAKSNGCCHGFSIRQVLEYDEKITASVKVLDAAHIEYKAAQNMLYLAEDR